MDILPLRPPSSRFRNVWKRGRGVRERILLLLVLSFLPWAPGPDWLSPEVSRWLTMALRTFWPHASSERWTRSPWLLLVHGWKLQVGQWCRGRGRGVSCYPHSVTPGSVEDYENQVRPPLPERQGGPSLQAVVPNRVEPRQDIKIRSSVSERPQKGMATIISVRLTQGSGKTAFLLMDFLLRRTKVDTQEVDQERLTDIS